MIRRELAKDPKLATESWDRFLPQFRKRHLKTSEKTAKKNAAGVNGSSGATGSNNIAVGSGIGAETSKKPAKKVYTPFPPAQLPRKVRRSYSLYRLPFLNMCVSSRWTCNLSLESISWQPMRKKRGRLNEGSRRYVMQFVCLSDRFLIKIFTSQQSETTAKRREERAAPFVAPVEKAELTVEEKRQRKRKTVTIDVGDVGEQEDKEDRKEKKKRRKQNTLEMEKEMEAEEPDAVEKSRKKKKKHSGSPIVSRVSD